MLDVLDTMKTAIQNNDTAAIRAAADDLEPLSERVNSQAATVGNRVQLPRTLSPGSASTTLP
jgi:hypothetical protein